MAHRRQEGALGLVGVVGSAAGIVRIREQPGVVDRDRALLRQADEELEVGLGEAGAPPAPARPPSSAARPPDR